MKIKKQISRYSPNKLSKLQILYLRKKWSKGILNISKEAKRLKVSRKTIYYWVKWGRNYKFQTLLEKSRKQTLKLTESKYINKILSKSCKECNSKKNIEIHHEIYPISICKIIDAIFEGKIYYLCFSCHSKKRRAK
jgi:IS30 family transposase